MVEQAQTYFKAAVWAAVLNAAATGAFVLFTVLSSLHGWPLRGLLGLADPVGATPTATNVSSSLGGDGLFGVRELAALRSRSAGAPSGGGATPGVDTHLSGPDLGSGPGAPTPDGQLGGAPSEPPGGTPGPLGPAGGPIGGAPDLPTPTLATPPALPPPAGPVVQQVGGAVSNAPATVESSVDSTVQSADTQLGGSLSDIGLSPSVQSATGALIGPNSAAGQAVGSAGGALPGLGGAG